MARVLLNEENYFVAAGKTLWAFSRNDTKQQKCVDVVETSVSLPKVAKPRSEGEKEETGNEVENTDKAQILCIALASDGNTIAVGTSLKTVLLYSADLSLIRAFRIPKAPTSISLDQEDKYVIVGDRAGHVCRYSVAAPENVPGYKDITGEMCGFEGEPLTGAISMVLDVAVSVDNKYLIVADRDEKVRIHRYPKAYVLEAVGLGHEHYVSSVDFAASRLFSTGGDSIVREWEISSGRPVSASDPVDEKPVKKIVVFVQDAQVKICAIVEGKSDLFVLKEEDGHFVVEKKIPAKSELLDISQNNGAVIGLTRAGIAVFDLATGSVEAVAVKEELKASLEVAREAVTNCFKNVTHNNMEDYQKRKAEKMMNEKEKKQRKRRRERNESADAELKKAVA